LGKAQVSVNCVLVPGGKIVKAKPEMSGKSKQAASFLPPRLPPKIQAKASRTGQGWISVGIRVPFGWRGRKDKTEYSLTQKMVFLPGLGKTLRFFFLKHRDTEEQRR